MCDQCPQEPERAGTSVSKRMAGSLTKEAVNKEKTAIDTELAIGADAIERLHTVISTLQSRVAIISNPTEGTDAREQRGPLGASPLYFRLFDNNNNVMSAVERLQALMRELEV